MEESQDEPKKDSKDLKKEEDEKDVFTDYGSVASFTTCWSEDLSETALNEVLQDPDDICEDYLYLHSLLESVDDIHAVVQGCLDALRGLPGDASEPAIRWT